MKTDLNENNLIPLTQPYYSSPWIYDGTESVTAIPNVDIVDWVLVELRETTGGPETALPNTVIAKKAGFLLRNGFIVDLDGISPLRVDANISYNLFAVVYHRNHIPVMSAFPVTVINEVYSYDFTTSDVQSYGGTAAVKELAPDIWGLFAADGNADEIIDDLDLQNSWNLQAGETGYKTGDFNLDTQVDNKDKDDIWVPNEGKGSQVPN
jgi:hypothetical protein